MRTVFLFVFLALSVSAVLAIPSWRCRACEDVVQTWHDKFHCAGNFLDWGDVNSPDIQACESPKLDCDKLTGRLKNLCLAMEHQFHMEGTYRRIIWENMMLTNDHYDTCVKLGKCMPDPYPPKMITKCHKLFKEPSCGKNVMCDKFPEHCTESCFLCNWLVKDFPLFQEMCKPDSARLPQSVVLPDDLPPSFLQTKEKVRAHTKASSRIKTYYNNQFRGSNFAGEQLTPRSVKNAADENPVTRLRTGYTLPQTCFDIWQDVKRNPKGRFFAQWKTYVGVLNQPIDRLKGEMWDANVVCKCLGYCEISRFEDLNLNEACRYEETNEVMMRELFSHEAELRVFVKKEKPEDTDPSLNPNQDETASGGDSTDKEG